MIDIHNFCKLKTQAACFDNGSNIYFFSNQFNALFVMNYHKKSCEYVTSFDRDPFFQESLYTKALYYADKIFLIPCVAANIAVYDIKKKETRYLYIEDEFLNYNVIDYREDEILLFPVKYRAWGWRISLSNEKVSKIELDFSGYEDLLKERESLCFYGNAMVRDFAYFAIYASDKYLVYDIVNNVCSIKTNEDGMTFTGAFKYESAVAFLSIDGTEVSFFDPIENVWNKKIALKYAQLRNTFSNGNLMAYTELIACEGGVLLCIPAFGNNLIIVKDYAVSESIDFDWDKLKLEKEDGQAFATIVEKDGTIILMPYECGVWGDLHSMELSLHNLDMKDDEIINIIKTYKDNGLPLIHKDIMNENEMTLKMFIQCL